MNPATQLHRHRRVVLYTCITLWVAAFVATHIPAAGVPPIAVRDVTLHAIGYFGLATAMWLTVFAYRGRAGRRAIMVISILAVYGAFDEITQPLVNRCAAWGDWFADVIGVLIAVVLLEIICRVARRTRYS